MQRVGGITGAGREQRWILAQERWCGAVVTRGCPGQVGAAAYWAVSVGGGREGTDFGPRRFLVPARGFRKAAGLCG